jgi:hypothetical protein
LRAPEGDSLVAWHLADSTLPIQKRLSKDVGRKISERYFRELSFAPHFSTATIPVRSDIKNHDGALDIHQPKYFQISTIVFGPGSGLSMENSVASLIESAVLVERLYGEFLIIKDQQPFHHAVADAAKLLNRLWFWERILGFAILR